MNFRMNASTAYAPTAINLGENGGDGLDGANGRLEKQKHLSIFAFCGEPLKIGVINVMFVFWKKMFAF